MTDSLLDIVRHSALFRDAGPELLAVIRARAVTRSIEEGGYFFMQGDPAAHAYVLFEGRVKLMQIAPGGQQVVMRIVTPGQTFAGIALLNPKAGYPVTAQAEADSAALAWDTQSLREFAERDPSISYNTMKLMHEYFTELQDRYRAVTTERVEQRVARCLLRLVAQTGKKVDGGVLIDIPLTRQDIAEMTGTTLYTVSRTLSEWERAGTLQIGRERVVITNPHMLVRIAEELAK